MSEQRVTEDDENNMSLILCRTYYLWNFGLVQTDRITRPHLQVSVVQSLPPP